jgi:hypothetical protein
MKRSLTLLLSLVLTAAASFAQVGPDNLVDINVSHVGASQPLAPGQTWQFDVDAHFPFPFPMAGFVTVKRTLPFGLGFNESSFPIGAMGIAHAEYSATAQGDGESAFAIEVSITHAWPEFDWWEYQQSTGGVVVVQQPSSPQPRGPKPKKK